MCDYRFGTDGRKTKLVVCPDEEYTEAYLKFNPYENVRPLVTMQAIISQLGVDNCYALTTVANSVEYLHKKEFVSKHYGICSEHIYSVGGGCRKDKIFTSLYQYME